MALLGAGKVQEASAEVATAIGIDPTAFDALYLSGVVNRRLGKTDAAIDAFQKAYEQGGADAVFAQFELGQLYDEAGQQAAAARAYKLFLQFVTQGPQAEYARKRLRDLAQA
jgi:tetratricopeptide (TPR) repeat protein